MLAGSTGLEPAASAVTGQRSNQLNYDPQASNPQRMLLSGGCGIDRTINVSEWSGQSYFPALPSGATVPHHPAAPRRDSLAVLHAEPGLVACPDRWWAVQDSNL